MCLHLIESYDECGHIKNQVRDSVLEAVSLCVISGKTWATSQVYEPNVVGFERSTKQEKADQNQEIHECMYGWDTESCRCWGLVRDVEVTALVDPDLCRDCYCKREKSICDSYDKEIDEYQKSIGRYKEYLRKLGRDDPLTLSLIAQNEKRLDDLKTGRRESLKVFRSSQGVWVGPCRKLSSIPQISPSIF